LLTSNLVFVVGVSFARRLWYWPTAILLLLLAAVLVRITDSIGKKVTLRTRTIATAALLLLLVSANWRDSPAWRSSASMVGYTLDIYPESWRALVNLARIEYLSGDARNGLAHAEKAMEIDPGQTLGWLVLAVNAMNLPEHQEKAQAAFDRLFEIDPADALGHLHYSRFLEQQRKYTPAAVHLRRYMELRKLPPDEKAEALEQLQELERGARVVPQ
jgi:tetratricopeptide (TPR) repeat protein